MHLARQARNGARAGLQGMTPAAALSPEPELCAVLAAREARWRERLFLARIHRLAVLSCTLRLPHALRLREESASLCRELWTTFLESLAGRVRQQRFGCSADGPEGLAVVDMPAVELKKAAILLEERHPLGWTIDLDVLDAEGTPLSRSELDPAESAPRPCLVCGRAARECIALRRHTREETCLAAETRLNARTTGKENRHPGCSATMPPTP